MKDDRFMKHSELWYSSHHNFSGMVLRSGNGIIVITHVIYILLTFFVLLL